MQSTVSSKQSSWNISIRPRRGWLEIPFQELLRCRELIRLFVWRNFAVTNTQSLLLLLGSILQPVLISLLYMVVFGHMIRLSTDGLPPFLFYFSGTVIWTYFSSSFIKISTAFTANTALFKKVYFPRLSVPVSIAISSLLRFGIWFTILSFLNLAFWLAGSGCRTSGNIFALPLCILLAAGWGMGFGLIVAAFTTRYNELRHFVGFGNQILFFVTPVIYPVSAVAENLQWLIWINPITPVVEGFRLSMLGAGTLQWNHLLWNLVFMLGTLSVGILLFNRAENTFVDRL